MIAFRERLTEVEVFGLIIILGIEAALLDILAVFLLDETSVTALAIQVQLRKMPCSITEKSISLIE